MSKKKNRYSAVEKQIDDALQEYVKLFSDIGFSENHVKSKIEEVDALIEHVNKRVEYAESRITKMVTFSVALIGAGLALFGVIAQLTSTSFYAGLISSGLLIITGVSAAILYVRQINPAYPFRGLENDWKWFYPKIIDEAYRPNSFVREDKNSLLKKRLLHVNGLTSYANRIIHENPSERLKADIAQLYLLHVNEKYKNAFLSHIRNVLKWGLVSVLISLAVFLTNLTLQKINNPEQPKKPLIAASAHQEKSQDHIRSLQLESDKPE